MYMRLYSFFRLLNYKIKQYEKAASNPFADKFHKRPITVIWVENAEKQNENSYR